MREPEQWTVDDIAKRLGVQGSTIRAYLARGQMPPATGKLGRTPWWAPRDIEPWLQTRKD